jgi:hypothetical protein
MTGLRLLTAWLFAVGIVVFNAPAWAAIDFVVTLLGTASPAPRAGTRGGLSLSTASGSYSMLARHAGRPSHS